MRETIFVIVLLVALVAATIVVSPFFWSPAGGPVGVLAHAWWRRRNASR